MPNPTNFGFNNVDWEYGYAWVKAASSSSATPGAAAWTDFGTPFDCPIGGTGGGPQPNSGTIVPGIQGTDQNPDFIWWFNGMNPDPVNYPTQLTLTLPSMSTGQYTWTITTGTTELAFSNNKQKIVTQQPQATVHSLAAGPVNSPEDITITVTTPPLSAFFGLSDPFPYGISYAPFYMTVRTPYKDVPDPSYPNGDCEAFSTRHVYPVAGGFSCLVHYNMVDQNSNSMPSALLIINENWPPDQAAQGVTTNWTPPGPIPCGGSCTPVSPPAWADELGMANQPSLIPPVEVPMMPLGNFLVMQTYGGWWVAAQRLGTA